jgi:two-component system response regulator DegU
MITVVIVDDHPVVRSGMKMALEATDDIVVVAEGGSGSEAIQLTERHSPDVLVLDINLPDKSGIEVARQLCRQNFPTSILILTALNEPRLIFELLENGVTGYILKDEALETLSKAVRAVARGESWLSPTVANYVVQRAIARNPSQTTTNADNAVDCLTPREHEIIRLLANGLDNTAIAEKLTLSKRTVQNHISIIYAKLGVASRAEAMLYAIHQGWTKISSRENTTYD